MSITIAAIATQLLLIVFPGLVLHRALAVRVLALDKATTRDADIGESDLVIYGLLPGLTIANGIGTILSLFGVFRPAVFLAVMAAAVAWRRRDAVATLAGIGHHCRAIWHSLARGELLTLVAIGIFAETAFGLLVNAQVPSRNVDVWNHNLPLAQSIVSHAGFVLPQIDNMFYGTYPIFFHMFFAEGLLFVDHVIAAKVINSLIYLGFLLSLLWCAKRALALSALALLLIVINNPFISNGAEEVMTDIPRVCFSVLALVFTYFHLRTGRLYYLFAAGLLAGGAVAGKYTELLTPALIGCAVLPGLLARRRESWIGAGVLAVGFVPIACYPYLRNWILLDNPIYPFMFAHPGLSDAYVADLRAEVFHSFDPAFRSYVQNMLSLQGWRDFFRAAQEVFLSHWNYSYYVLGLIGIGLLDRRSRLIFPVFATFVLAIFWYTVGNINTRWGLSGYMAMLATAFLAWTWVVDHAVDRIDAWMEDREVRSAARTRTWPIPVPPWPSPLIMIRVGLAGLALWICFGAVKNIRRDGWAGLLPHWTNHQLGKAVLAGELDKFLAQNLQGYQIYRFIGTHDLRMVLVPFDNGAGFYQAAYNGGRDGRWIVPWYRVPQHTDNLEEFLRSNDIRYFVYRASLDPFEIERLNLAANGDHVALAYELFRHLLPTSHPILVDPFGWTLYAIDGR